MAFLMACLHNAPMNQRAATLPIPYMCFFLKFQCVVKFRGSEIPLSHQNHSCQQNHSSPTFGPQRTQRAPCSLTAPVIPMYF